MLVRFTNQWCISHCVIKPIANTCVLPNQGCNNKCQLMYKNRQGVHTLRLHIDNQMHGNILSEQMRLLSALITYNQLHIGKICWLNQPHSKAQGQWHCCTIEVHLFILRDIWHNFHLRICQFEVPHYSLT